MHHRGARVVAWIAVGALLLPWGPAPSTAPERPAARRWLGPLASFMASVAWIRFDLALRDGERERAYLLAEEALALEPRAPEGWSTLARHLLFDRASLESEPEPAARRRWIEAGLAVFQRGEQVCADPGQLAYLRGTVLTGYVAEIAEPLAWPGGAVRALEEGVRDLERAARLGFEGAEELLQSARATLAERARE